MVLAVQRELAGGTTHTLPSLGDTRGKWLGKQNESHRFAPSYGLVM